MSDKLSEAEWLAGTDWDSMLVHLGGRAFNRKFLLLAVALCRRVWDRLPFDECRQIVEAVERLADHPDVETASEGEGSLRKVVIRLKGQ